MTRIIKDVVMWPVFLITLIGMTALTWPLYFVKNIKRISRENLFFVIGLIFLALDQLTKLIIIYQLELGQSIPVIENVFHITRVHNYGAAFGLFQGQYYLFVGVAFLSVGFIVLFVKTLGREERWTQAALGFLLAGAVGNLIDRLSYGYVVDFLEFKYQNFAWPVFNVADAVIDIGVAMLLLELFFFSSKTPSSSAKPASISEEEVKCIQS